MTFHLPIELLMPQEQAPADPLDQIMAQWDELDNAAQRVLTSQPFQMTANAAHLDEQRLKMRRLLMTVTTQRARTAAAASTRTALDPVKVMQALYELAGKRPSVGVEEPTWGVDLFEVERRARELMHQ